MRACFYLLVWAALALVCATHAVCAAPRQDNAKTSRTAEVAGQVFLREGTGGASRTQGKGEQAGTSSVNRRPERADDLRREYEVLSTEYAASASEIVSDGATGWRPRDVVSGSILFVAPDEYSPVAQTAAAPSHESRVDYADKLFALARRAAEAGQLSLAFQWATETLREDPDHADARRVLGYEKRDGKWLTPYGVRMADAGKRWHAKFGWAAPEDVPRYEAGERPLGKRWISAEDDAARHREMKNGWQVRTDHFLVTTNHSLEAAAELAARLERLHQVWRQLFAGFYLTENEVRRLFAGERQPRKQVRPFRVYYHRDRHEYADALRKYQPRIAETLGIYFAELSAAHFFATDGATTLRAVPAGQAKTAESARDENATGEPPVATLYHEAVHQLFQETKPSVRGVGDLVNFWVVEGVATYFETLREHDDPASGLYFTIGEPDAGRLPAAKERLQERFYVPLAELTKLGKAEMQRHAEVSKLYSQSSGLAAFLMDGEDGRYREALVRYLTAVYAGRDNDRSLAEEAGADYSRLDAAYRKHVESLP
jgi:hypothetical protein